MKRIIFTITAALSTLTGFCQLPYNLYVTSLPYEPLVNGTSLNGTSIWKDTMYSIPLGFNFKLGTQTIDRFNLMNGNFVATDTIGTISGFLLTEAALIDRGAVGNQSLSPVRYEITGTPGNRIFKAEISNAGFANELSEYNTLDDSANMQIWLYEGSNIVELRYGKSEINHPEEYFDMMGGQPVVGYVKDLNFMNASLDKVYLLSGDPAGPTIDSFSLTNPFATALDSFPVAHIVYRFTPKTGTNSIGGKLELKDLKVYPTLCENLLHIDFSEQRSVSYHVMAINGSVTGLSGTLTQGTNAVDISGLPAGTYLLRLKDAQQQTMVKFIRK